MKVLGLAPKGMLLIALLGLCAAFQFPPRLGDEATYEVTTPVGTNITRRVLESFDAAKNRYEIAVYAEAQGKVQKQTDWVDAAKLEESFIADLRGFCAARGGQIVSADFDGKAIEACRTLKDNGVLKQEDFWVAGVPFGLLFAEKKSPLHPKAGTTTRLMSFQLIPR